MSDAPIPVGWHDEMDRPSAWEALKMENQARLNVALPGKILLSLGHVPAGWPYTFQWSGVSQDAFIDVAAFPILMARVDWVEGYAHLDIDVVDRQGKVVKTLRSSTLNKPGASTINLSGSLDPAVYHLRIRMIVGGDNSGCSATYGWIRSIRQRDSQFLTDHPEWRAVREVPARIPSLIEIDR